jgi:CRISPR/Cas system-associated exonuclease Cas4 (RecB family)
MIKTFTSDHFETYTRCPKAYYFKYIKGIRFALAKDTYQLGRSIHSLVYYKLRGLPIKKIEKDLDETTSEHWHNLSDNQLLEANCVCSEWGFDIPLNNDLWLNGRIDAVFEKDGKYIIVDWKTGQSLPKDPESKYQAMIYMLAFYKAKKDLGLDFEPEDLSFVFVGTHKKGDERKIICSKDKLVEIEQILLGMASEIEEQTDFCANKKSCTFCDFAQICEG